jgi:hypothetical protein
VTKTTLYFLFLFCSSVSSAAISPNLQSIDEYLGQPDWQGSFAKPQSIETVFVEKGVGSPSKSLYKVQSELGDQNTLKVLNLDQNGKEISSFQLQRQDWENVHGNWVRIFISQTESYGFKMSIEEITSVQVNVQVNGAPVRVGALQARVVGKNQLGWTLTQTYIITNELRGMSQLLFRDEIQSFLGTKILRSHQVLSVQDL